MQGFPQGQRPLGSIMWNYGILILKNPAFNNQKGAFKPIPTAVWHYVDRCMKKMKPLLLTMLSLQSRAPNHYPLQWTCSPRKRWRKAVLLPDQVFSAKQTVTQASRTAKSDSQLYLTAIITTGNYTPCPSHGHTFIYSCWIRIHWSLCMPNVDTLCVQWWRAPRAPEITQIGQINGALTCTWGCFSLQAEWFHIYLCMYVYVYIYLCMYIWIYIYFLEFDPASDDSGSLRSPSTKIEAVI